MVGIEENLDLDGSSESKQDEINVNENIVTLLLRLHSKYSESSDSYVPKYQRHGISVTEDYLQSRIGNGCFFIEKVLDKIGDFDKACAESISACRQLLWPGKFHSKYIQASFAGMFLQYCTIFNFSFLYGQIIMKL